MTTALDLSKNKSWRTTDPKKSAEYARGFKDGFKGGSDDAFNKFAEKFYRDLNDVGGFAEQVMEILNKYSIKLQNTVLKVHSSTSFRILFWMSESDLLSDNFHGAMAEISEYEDSVSSEYRDVIFSFTDTGDGFDPKLVKANGYYLTHQRFSSEGSC